MRIAASVACAVTAGVCLFTWSGNANAIGPADAVVIEGGGTIGYGSNPSHGPNPLGVSIGARAGVSVYNVYAGLAISYYFGTTGDCGGGAPASGAGVMSLPTAFCNATAAEVSLGQMAVLYGLDLGYTLTFPRAKYLKIRPILELGDAEITRTGTVGSSDITGGSLSQYRSQNGFYVQPGLTLLLAVDAFFIGADANLLVIPGIADLDGVGTNPDGSGTLMTSSRALVAFTTHAQIGFRF